MSNSNNLFPDETSGTQPAEVNTPIPELPTKPSPQQQPEHSPTLPDNESSAQSLEIEESPITGRKEALTINYAIGKLNDYLLWFLLVLEVTLLIEFFLMLIGAPQNNLFAGFMYALTVIPLYPFNGIVPSTELGNSGAVIEWSTLIAMAVYFLAFYALRRFLSVLISRPEVSPGVNRAEDTIIRSAINNPSISNYRQLAKAIIHRIGATDERLIQSSSFESGTVWEISLPSIGLRLETGRAIFFLRNTEKHSSSYKRLIEIKSAQKADFLFVVDYSNIGSPPPPIDPNIIWLKSKNLKEMGKTPRDEAKAWLGRLIASQIKNFEDVIPYHTEGPEDLLFVGRNTELHRLSGGIVRGGIIVGAHKSGKTSLLMQLGERLEKQDYVVGGPYTIHSTNFQIFFYDTLRILNIDVPTDISLESWSSILRGQSKEGKRLVLLLDEVDTLLDQDAKVGHDVGREIRALQNDGYCKFYLAGHNQLREATTLEHGPFRNFAEEITLKGLDEIDGIKLIQEPIGDIGFTVSNQQAQRIFNGTDGVAVLIQGFCRRLLIKIHSSRDSLVPDPVVPDSAIKIIEKDPDYLNMVFDYYEYAQTWDSMAVMLITARLKKSNRQNIIQIFSEYGVKLTWDQLDKLLKFLVRFGVLEQFESDRYQVLSKYLYKAIEARSGKTDAFLVSQFEKGKRER